MDINKGEDGNQEGIGICQSCGCHYSFMEYLGVNKQYLEAPCHFQEHCCNHCLACLLGVGPIDFPNEQNNENDLEIQDTRMNYGGNHNQKTADNSNWPYAVSPQLLIDGDLKTAFENYLKKGYQLVILPIARLWVDCEIIFPGPIVFLPAGTADLDQLNCRPNQTNTRSLAERSSAASGITLEVLDKHSLVIFPYELAWDDVLLGSHKKHLEIIRYLSNVVEFTCLDFVRYKSCKLEIMDDLPAHPGQVYSNHMMAGALLYDPTSDESRILGGAAFTHYITRGLGLPLEHIEWHEFPRDGEIGKIVRHALSSYASLIECEYPTARFMQALGMLEFLAYPDEYQKFEKVSRVIARYIAKEPTHYQRLLERFFELTGKKDPNSGKIIGYRTRVVHMGERIEQLIPIEEDRRRLFQELDSYIRPVINHMIVHSDYCLEDYLEVRNRMRPFEKVTFSSSDK